MAAEDEKARTAKPWPVWLLRFMVSDEESAFEALIWSVGGSPPYGGISYEEAAAVFELLEDFRGPGAASQESYAKVRSFLSNAPDRDQVLDLFQCYDAVCSAPKDYSRAVVSKGRQIADAINHGGARALFLLYDSQLQKRQGDPKTAANLAVQALRELLSAAEEEPIYAKRVADAGQNAIAFTALAGEIDRATQLLNQVAEVLRPEAVLELSAWLSSQRK